MWIQAEPAFRASLYFTDLFGSVLLAQADAAQRLHYLTSRLLLGATCSCLRSQVLRKDDVLYAVDRAELDNRLNLMMEAGAEGCVTILQGLIDEIGAAQMRWARHAFAHPEIEPPALQLGFSDADPLVLSLRRDARVGLSAGG
ncbi:MAG: hypothetical protein J0L85_20975 [Zoogloea sp.]|nr:hypothetical protein [Zoogloea sp.]